MKTLAKTFVFSILIFWSLLFLPFMLMVLDHESRTYYEEYLAPVPNVPE